MIEFPFEIWKNILTNINDEELCIKFFMALPKFYRIFLQNDFYEHYNKLKNKYIGILVGNKIIIYENERKLFLFERPFSTVPFSIIKFRPGSDEVVGAGYDNNIYFWNYKTGILQRRFMAIINNFKVLEFSRCGNFLALASRDGIIEVWNLFNLDSLFRSFSLKLPYFRRMINDPYIEFRKDKFELLVCLRWYINDNFDYENQILTINLERRTINNYSRFDNLICQPIRYSQCGNFIEYCKDKIGIFSTDKKKQIYRDDNVIEEFLINNEYIYCLIKESLSNESVTRNFIKCVNLKTKEREILHYHSTSNISNFKLDKNGKKLLFLKNGNLFIYDLSYKRIAFTISKEKIKHDCGYNLELQQQEIFSPEVFIYDIKLN